MTHKCTKCGVELLEMEMAIHLAFALENSLNIDESWYSAKCGNCEKGRKQLVNMVTPKELEALQSATLLTGEEFFTYNELRQYVAEKFLWHLTDQGTPYWGDFCAKLVVRGISENKGKEDGKRI
jgi:hypothetical protein